MGHVSPCSDGSFEVLILWQQTDALLLLSLELLGSISIQKRNIADFRLLLPDEMQ